MHLGDYQALLGAVHLQAIGGVNYWEEAGLYNVTGGCSRITRLPTITFMLDGTDYPLTPQEYILQVCTATKSSICLDNAISTCFCATSSYGGDR